MNKKNSFFQQLPICLFLLMSFWSSRYNLNILNIQWSASSTNLILLEGANLLKKDDTQAVTRT